MGFQPWTWNNRVLHECPPCSSTPISTLLISLSWSRENATMCRINVTLGPGLGTCALGCSTVLSILEWQAMDAMVYLEQENGTLAAPSIKFRQRLQSAPEHLLKTPLKKWLGAPVQSGRKALGTVNKIVATPATSHKGDVLNKPLAAQQCKVAPQPVCEDYPEIEKCFPYDPSDFEVYCVPEEVCISHFSLAGLGKQQWPLNVLEEDSMIQLCLPLSPLKIPSEHCRDDLEAFLETISELTVDLPSECDS